MNPKGGLVQLFTFQFPLDNFTKRTFQKIFLSAVYNDLPKGTIVNSINQDIKQVLINIIITELQNLQHFC